MRARSTHSMERRTRLTAARLSALVALLLLLVSLGAANRSQAHSPQAADVAEGLAITDSVTYQVWRASP